MKDTINFILSAGSLTPSTDTIKYMNTIKDKMSNGDEIMFQRITKATYRSIQWHKRYWSAELPVIASYVEDIERFVTIVDETGKFDYRMLHRYLMLKFAIDCNRPDLIVYIPTIRDGVDELVPIVSESFNSMTQKDFREYQEFLRMYFLQKTGLDLDEVIVSVA